jgi:ferrous iron transport protein A
MTTLVDLKPNDVATVSCIDGNDDVAVRLMEMGILEGEKITLVRYAPLGDPIEFLVRGYRLSLRANEAKRVQVEQA